MYNSWITRVDHCFDRTGVLSVDVLTMGGVSTTVTFGEMVDATLEGCTLIDGTIGMGLTNEYESNAFENMVEVRKAHAPACIPLCIALPTILSVFFCFFVIVLCIQDRQVPVSQDRGGLVFTLSSFFVSFFFLCKGFRVCVCACVRSCMRNHLLALIPPSCCRHHHHHRDRHQYMYWCFYDCRHVPTWLHYAGILNQQPGGTSTGFCEIS